MALCNTATDKIFRSAGAWVCFLQFFTTFSLYIPLCQRSQTMWQLLQASLSQVCSNQSDKTPACSWLGETEFGTLNETLNSLPRRLSVWFYLSPSPQLSCRKMSPHLFPVVIWGTGFYLAFLNLREQLTVCKLVPAPENTSRKWECSPVTRAKGINCSWMRSKVFILTVCKLTKWWGFIFWSCMDPAYRERSQNFG